MDQKTHLLIRPLLQLTNKCQKECHWSLTNAVVHNELCKFSWGHSEGEMENVYAVYVVFLPCLILGFQLLWETEDTDFKSHRVPLPAIYIGK